MEQVATPPSLLTVKSWGRSGLGVVVSGRPTTAAAAASRRLLVLSSANTASLADRFELTVFSFISCSAKVLPSYDSYSQDAYGEVNTLYGTLI